MDRPTCKTCPYWDEMDPDEDDKPIGMCHLLPPQYTGKHTSEDSSKSACLEAWDFPWTRFDMGCGQHPDFPDWIAARDKHDPSPASPLAFDPSPVLARCLKKKGISTIEDFAKRTSADLLSIWSIGPARLERIRTWLHSHGMKLADE
jgi:hypothetical protein